MTDTDDATLEKMARAHCWASGCNVPVCKEAGHCKLETDEDEIAAMRAVLSLLPTPTVGEGWQELAELSAKATAGPWSVRDEAGRNVGFWDVVLVDGQDDLTVSAVPFTSDNQPGARDDAAFIVAAVNHVRSALSASPQVGDSPT